jgi:hypothetical protein
VFSLSGAALMVPTASAAPSISGALFAASVERAVDRPLPTLAEVLGQDITAPAGPIIAIGPLDNADWSEAKDWGGAIGWYLMEAVNDGMRSLAVIPPYQFKSDGRTETEDRTASRRVVLSRVAERTGARFGLTGRIDVRGNQFNLALELLEYPGGNRLAGRNRKGELGALSASVHALAQELLTEAVSIAYPNGAPLADALAVPAPGELDILATAFGKAAKSASWDKQVAAFYETLWREHRDVPSTATLYLFALDNGGSAAELRARLPELLASRPRTKALETYGYLLQSQNAERGIDPAAVTALTEILVANPNNLGAWLALANAYLGERVMYREDERGMLNVISPAVDHHIGYASGIALSLALVRRWPNYYRGWWALSYGLKGYAGLVRGVSHTRNIPATQLERYHEIMAVADASLSEAIRRHPAQGALYGNRIAFDVENGRDWMSTFRLAAQIDPHSRWLYQTAFNYGRPQWGGTKESLREIYDTAKRNNPDADWPRQLRDAWAPEIKPLIDFDNPWTLAGLAIIALLVVGLAGWQYWNSRS